MAEQGKGCYYCHDGDTIEVLLSDEEYYGEWLCDHVTIYRGRETGAVVGVWIDDVRGLMKGEVRGG